MYKLFLQYSCSFDHHFDRALFLCFKFIDKIHGTKKSRKEIRNILVLDLDHIGDVLLSTPAISFLDREYPEAKITVAVTDLCKNVIKGNPHIDEVVTITAPWLNQKKAGFSLKSMMALFKWGVLLRRNNYDLVIDFRGAESKNILLSWLTGANNRLGYGVSRRGVEQLNTCHVINKSDDNVVFQKVFSLEKYLNKKFVSNNLFIKISDDDINYAEKLWKEYNLNNEEMVICIHPESNKKISQWPIESFIELSILLNQHFRTKILVTGIKNETELIFIDKNPLIISLIGKTNIFQLAAVISKCNLIIGNDTGPMHIAAAVKTPAVTIFSAAYNPKALSPFGIPYRIITKKINCNLCVDNNKICNTFECIKSIDYESVFYITKEFINGGFKGNNIINI